VKGECFDVMDVLVNELEKHFSDSELTFMLWALFIHNL